VSARRSAAVEATPGPPPAGEVPAGELWRLILRAWCGSSLDQVCAQVQACCDLAPAEVEATVLGLMNASITTLPPAMAEAFERGLGHEVQEVQADERSEDMARVASRPIKAVGAPAGRAEVPAETGPAAGRDQEEQELQPERSEERAPAESNGGPGRSRRSPDLPADRPVARMPGSATLTAEGSEGSEDAETEALVACARHLGRLTDAEARRVLEYLAARFVADIPGR